MLEQRLAKNSVEVYIQEIKDTPFRPRQKLPTMRFGVASAPGEITSGILEADGLVLPEKDSQRSVRQIGQQKSRNCSHQNRHVRS